jgi:AbrB family looped-hinge helix DNA binding protein
MITMSMEITFTVKVQALGRIAIPKEIREALEIADGNLVTVNIRKVETRKRDVKGARVPD